MICWVSGWVGKTGRRRGTKVIPRVRPQVKGQGLRAELHRKNKELMTEWKTETDGRKLVQI